MMLTVAFMPINSFAYAANTEAETDFAQMETVQVGEKGEVDETANVKAIKDSVSDETVYNPLYFMEHGNSDYINMDEVRMSDFAAPVVVGRGVATYNHNKQTEWEFGENSIMSMTYDVPVYDLDENSDYYVAFPNVNLNNDRIGSYDFTIIYDNDYAEKINDYIYENNIAYIKKDAIDNPKNERELQSDGIVAMQLNYYFKDLEVGDDRYFSKKVPVQILENKEPTYKTVEVENMFADNSISFPIGDYDKSKLHVMVNGSVLPINENAYDVVDGTFILYSSAAVLSSVNIVVEDTTVAESIKNALADDAKAAVTPENMRYYKTSGGKEVIVAADTSKIYPGWRGTYQVSKAIKTTHYDQDDAPNTNGGTTIGDLKDLPEWNNSLNYMYGAHSTNPDPGESYKEAYEGYWALASYTKGVNVANNNSINRTTEYNNPYDDSSAKKTIYEWMVKWTNNLERNNGKTSTDSNNELEKNGLGGINNFAVPWPKLTIKGNERNLISDSNADGYGTSNPNLKFDTQTESGKTVLTGNDYFAATCAHLGLSAGASDGDYDDENKNTVYVSCLAVGDDYIVLCFAIAGIAGGQEAMAVYKFRTGTPVTIQKTSARESITDSNGCYSYNGSTFKLYETEADAKANRDVVTTFKTDAKGESAEQSIAPGTYYIVETATGKGYSIPDAYKASNGGKKITVSGGKSQTFTVANVPQVGNIVLKKTDDLMEKQQGNAELINAQFLVKYYDGQYSTQEAAVNSGEPTRVWHMKTTDLGGEYGIDFSNPKHTDEYSGGKEDSFYSYPAGNYVAPIGTYVFEEIAGPKGYKTINDVKIMNVTENSNNAPIIDTVDSKYPNVVKRGGVHLQKRDNDTDTNVPQGNATLEGAEFTIVNTSNHPVMVRDVEYLSAGSTVDWDNARNQRPTGIKKVEPGEVVGILKTNADGYTKSLTNDLPYGKYKITETKASAGYKIDTKFELNITIDDSTADKLAPTKPEEYTAQEPVKRGDVYLEKWDKELNKSESIGGKGHDSSKHTGTDLNGIQFTIKNVSQRAVVTPVVVDPKAEGYKGNDYWKAMWAIENGESKALGEGTAKRVEPNGVVGIITTHWNEEKKAYEAHTGGMSLPYGTYEITETRTNKFYELTDKAKRVIEILEDGTVVDKTKDANPLVWKDYVYRQNIAFEKAFRNLNAKDERAQYIPFKITNNASGEYHYVVVDQNGQYNSWVHPHSRNTNGYDKYIDGVVKQGGEVDSNKLKEIMLGDEIEEVAPGTWFNLGEDGTKASVNDEFAAFPYGTYTVEELKCTNNKGYKIIEPFTFEVKRPQQNIVNRNVEPKNTGVNFDVTNAPKIPKIGTTAKDSKTGIDLGVVGKEVTIVDTVKYEDLNEGQEYKLVGILMEKSTGKSLKVGGKEVTSTKTFTPEEESGEIDVEFELNTESLKGKDIVVFEKLLTKENGEEVQKAEHEKIDAMGQTIHFPDMGTTAADVKTGINVGAPSEKTEIVDKVAYKNLTEGKEYTVKGVLMDKATGEPIKDGDKEVRAEKKFTAETSDGEVELTFTLNASALQGQAVVAFEHLHYEGIEVVAHADIEDEGQTVTFPEIGTTAKDGQTETNVGVVGEKATIVDTVEYKNLMPNKKYTVKGVLMDKETKEPLKDGDKEITAERTFTADEADGTIDVTFTFDSSLLKGKSVVVFEDIYYKDVKLATHADIEDEGQTIDYPDAGTQAKDAKTGTNKGTIGEKVEIIDTVSYTNLVPNKEYTVKGTLMDKETGEPIKENGKAVTASQVFTPKEKNGTVEVKFTLNSMTLQGKSIVVFEDVVYKKITVVSHADIEDAAQTIDYPGAKTEAKDAQTKDRVGVVGKKVQIIDTVSYKNLSVDKEYTVKGTLMNKETGKPITENGKVVTAEQKFTPKESNGTVQVTFELDSTTLKGKSAVVFEDVYDDKIKVVSHADITDEAQTIDYNDLKTNATVDGKHVIVSDKVVDLVDEVTYTNLTVGKEYTIKGKLMDKKTGKPVKVNGKEITASQKITARTPNGSAKLTFKADAKALKGKTTVVFEELYYGKVKIGEHADLKDKNQTVRFGTIGNPNGSNGGASGGSSDGGGISGGSNSQTSDIVLWSLLALLMATALVAGVRYRRSR